MHQLRRLRGGVPGRHRAHRPHQRHAPPPGPGRVGVPARGHRDAEQPGAQGQPVGMAEDRRADWISELDFEVQAARRPASPTTSSTSSGSGCAGALQDWSKRTTKAIAELLHLAVWISRGSARPRRAPATRPAALATSSSSACSPSRISRPQRCWGYQGMRKKVIASCPHCFNTISRESRSLAATTRWYANRVAREAR